jgi:hypothetical protein
MLIMERMYETPPSGPPGNDIFWFLSGISHSKRTQAATRAGSSRSDSRFTTP